MFLKDLFSHRIFLFFSSNSLALLSVLFNIRRESIPSGFPIRIARLKFAKFFQSAVVAFFSKHDFQSFNKSPINQASLGL